MTSDHHRLARHITLALTAKFALLAVLWFAFFHDPHPRVAAGDAAVRVASHMIGPLASGAGQ